MVLTHALRQASVSLILGVSQKNMKILILPMVLSILLFCSSSAIAENLPTQKKDNMLTTTPKVVKCTIPVLPVRDLKRSIAFYTETLGFKLDWGGAEGDMVCSVSRDKRCIMLMQKEKTESPAWVWIGADVSLFDLFRSKGVKVFQEPRNYSWAYEMKFADIDGNILWLGSDPKKDQPFEDKKNG
jgi:predicted lactoylglutathione lyase